MKNVNTNTKSNTIRNIIKINYLYTDMINLENIIWGTKTGSVLAKHTF